VAFASQTRVDCWFCLNERFRVRDGQEIARSLASSTSVDYDPAQTALQLLQDDRDSVSANHASLPELCFVPGQVVCLGAFKGNICELDSSVRYPLL